MRECAACLLRDEREEAEVLRFVREVDFAYMVLRCCVRVLFICVRHAGEGSDG